MTPDPQRPKKTSVSKIKEIVEKLLPGGFSSVKKQISTQFKVSLEEEEALYILLGSLISAVYKEPNTLYTAKLNDIDTFVVTMTLDSNSNELKVGVMDEAVLQLLLNMEEADDKHNEEHPESGGEEHE